MNLHWITVIAATALTVGACDRMHFGAPEPPSAPTPKDVETTISSISNVAPQTYAAAGYVTVREKCGEFFDRLTLYKANSDFLNAETATAGATAAGMLALLAASTTAIGVVGMGTGLIAASIANFQNFALATPYPIETRQLVFAAMLTAEAAKPANQVKDPFDARSTVAAFAQYCTYSGIAALSRQALQNGASNTINAGPGGALPDAERKAIANLAGGPLTDKQLALILLLGGDYRWTPMEREVIAEATELSPGQKAILMQNDGVLNGLGKAIASVAKAIKDKTPAFAVLVEDLRTTIQKNAGKGRDALVKLLTIPTVTISDPIPTPRVIVGR